MDRNRMRVTIYTENEPPEHRPCPPLPLDGPILLEFVPSPISMSAPVVPVLPDTSAVGTSAIDTSPSVLLSSSKHFSGSFRSWVIFALTTLLPAVVLLAVFFLPLVLGRMRSGISTHGPCPAWPESDSPLSDSCPRLDSGIFLSESSPYSCPVAARRGEADLMARGLTRASLALDAKRAYVNCRLSARRGLSASLIMGILNPSLVASLLGYVKSKYRSAEGFGHVNEKRPSVGGFGYIQVRCPLMGNLKSMLIRVVLCLKHSFVKSISQHEAHFEKKKTEVFGGGPRQTINGRLLSPYLVRDNGIVSWIHMEYSFEFQCARGDLTSVLQRHRNCVAVDI
ncbi:hypothetical protein DFH06DRAFT_1465958, partial [Mycena polygramma]